MAEDLGEITIKFGDDEGSKRPTQPTRTDSRAVSDSTKAAMSGILANLPAITRVAQAGVQGYGLGGVVSATRMAASGLAGAGAGAASILAPVLAIAAGVGGIAVAAYAIKSFVGKITDRISELAAVSGPMAMQEAMTKLSEMRRDMREAQVLGPMYIQVSQLVNKIKDLLQPFLMAVRAALLSIIIPILEKIAELLTDLFNMIPQIVQFLNNLAAAIQVSGGVGQAAGIAGAALPGSMAGLKGIFGIMSWLFPASQTSHTANTLSAIASTLAQFYQAFQSQQPQGANGWALNTLNALATGGVMVQQPNLPAPIFVPVRKTPSRLRRTSSPTP